MRQLYAEPPKAAFANIQTGEIFRFQFNPPELVEGIEVNWARLNPVGLSHQILHYINTNNHQFPLVIYLSDVVAAIQSAVARSSTIPVNPNANRTMYFVQQGATARSETKDTGSGIVYEAKQFIQSLAYPVKKPSGEIGPPPRVLFVWPDVVRMECVLTAVRFTHRRFSLATARTIALVAEVNLEEIRLNPLYSGSVETRSGVRYYGSMRNP